MKNDGFAIYKPQSSVSATFLFFEKKFKFRKLFRDFFQKVSKTEKALVSGPKISQNQLKMTKKIVFPI